MGKLAVDSAEWTNVNPSYSPDGTEFRRNTQPHIT